MCSLCRIFAASAFSDTRKESSADTSAHDATRKDPSHEKRIAWWPTNYSVLIAFVVTNTSFSTPRYHGSPPQDVALHLHRRCQTHGLWIFRWISGQVIRHRARRSFDQGSSRPGGRRPQQRRRRLLWQRRGIITRCTVSGSSRRAQVRPAHGNTGPDHQPALWQRFRDGRPGCQVDTAGRDRRGGVRRYGEHERRTLSDRWQRRAVGRQSGYRAQDARCSMGWID